MPTTDPSAERFHRYFHHPDPRQDVLNQGDRAAACRNLRDAFAYLKVSHDDAGTSDPELFDEELSALVKKFQREYHATLVDGKVGPNTRRLLILELLARFGPTIFARLQDNAYSRIYIHAPYKPDPLRAEVKKGVLAKLRKLGFDPQEFHVSGLPQGDAWTFDRAIEVMRQCDGALILALMRWSDSAGPIPSEYSHFEGALALSCNLPTLVLAEEGMQMRGILSQAGGSFVLQIPMNNSAEWLAKDQLLQEPPFEKWVERVRGRYDVFFGYCSKADELARNIKKFLVEEAGLRVLDWATDFRPGRTIMEEVARATATCRCGLFLFTADDPLEGSPSKTAIPRDNVLLEAGYFMSAHSARRLVVVREKGTKMPADLGGMIYLTIEDREHWEETAREVADSLRAQMAEDV